MKATLISGAIRWVALGALVVFFGGASHLLGASQQQGDQTAVAAVVEQIWKEYSASLNAGELDRWLSLWTEDGVQMPPGEPPVVGKQRIRVRMQGVLGQFAFDITITNQEVAAADDWAYSRGVYKATLTPKQGGETVPIDGKYMTILRRQSDGSWKIHRDIFNSNVAPTK